MNRHQLLRCLLDLFPEFASEWDSAGNDFRRGDEYTVHGVCCAFSLFFEDHASSLPEPRLEQWFATVETILAADPHDQDTTANALGTCFLENIAGTDPGQLAQRFMGPASRKIFDYWH